jgi:hypothetical protein
LTYLLLFHKFKAIIQPVAKGRQEGSIKRKGDYHEILDKKTSLENTVVWNQPIPQGYPNKQIGNVIGE